MIKHYPSVLFVFLAACSCAFAVRHSGSESLENTQVSDLGSYKAALPTSSEQSKKIYDDMSKTFSDRTSIAAPVAMFAQEKGAFSGTECAEQLPDGTFSHIANPLTLTFTGQGISNKQNGLALKVQADPARVSDPNYLDGLRKQLLTDDKAHTGNQHHIALMDERQPVKTGKDGKASLFYSRSLHYATSKSGPFDWIDYELREVQRNGQKDYMLKATRYHVPFMKYQDPPEIKLTTYCW